ncbi:MAG TPA: GNAT family N-acetyltransferase [Tepidisphaeraceae bacterium]|jgi:GNAT superfamily N-acetyltransferase|nr:GNAT family N-acetyltransferase [Tepidisphaeraceae bacterium]
MPDTIQIRPARLSEIIDLRHRILRAGLPRETAIFSGDELPTSRHFGAFIVRAGSEEAVGCATFHLNTWENQPAWQLRGMATSEEIRGKGVGRGLLQWAERELLAVADAPRVWWCNARVPAIGFYELNGWKVVSEPFDIPTAGPHVRMARRFA